MTATHAKGPWTWSREYGEIRIVTRDDANNGDYDNALADVYGGDATEQEANARLIAAAPELLEACIEARKWLFANFPENSGPQRQSAEQKVLAAIAKVEARPLRY